jgi:uncharacterized membrane protein (UPF0136 family)
MMPRPIFLIFLTGVDMLTTVGYSAPVQLAPQGFFGNLVSQLAPIAGNAIGGLVGHPNAGAQVGNVAGNIARLLPFSAGPQLAPQGFFGDLVGHLAPIAGNAIGGLIGHPNAGAQVGNVAGNIARLLPFSAGPQLAPQGFFGDLVGHLAPIAGNAIGGLIGHPNAGAQVGNVAGNIARLLPFSAGPQLAPQGVLGDLVHSAGNVLSHVVHSPIVGAIAHAAPGIANSAGYHTVGSVLSILTSQLGDHPIGNALSQLAPLLGNKAAEVFGQPALATIGAAAGQGAALLPFAAAPTFYQAR